MSCVEAAIRAHLLGRASVEIHEVMRGKSHDPSKEVGSIFRTGNSVLQIRNIRVDGVVICEGESERR